MGGIQAALARFSRRGAEAAVKTPSVVGYLDRLFAHAGDELTVRVSVLDPSRRYTAELVRMICGETGLKGPGLKEEKIETGLAAQHEGIEQPTPVGSYAIVEKLPPLQAVELSLLAWPTMPGRSTQTLIHLGALRLFLDDAGAVALSAGGDTISTGRPLRPCWWYRVTAHYDPRTGAATVASAPFEGPHNDRRASVKGRLPRYTRPTAPMLFAASSMPGSGTADHFYGKLEAPALRSGKLTAQWDFARGMGTGRIEETSSRKLHGRLVNAPKRAVTGSRWDGSVHDWRQNPSHYAAIHFHGDDLYDARWKPSLAIKLPKDLKSGFYAVKLQASGPAFYVGFIVSPGPRAKRTKLAVLASTVTYLAYANYRRRMTPGPIELAMGALPTVDMTDILLAEHPEFGNSTYDVHRDGFGVSHASIRRPLFNMRPGGRFWNFAMDLCLIDWLDHAGIAYDVITDHELHAQGAGLLKRYRAVMTGSHPEYYSLEMLRACERFLAAGGRFMYMGGNGFYWRVTFPPAYPGMIELRRAEDGTRAWAEKPGQYYHATGEYGGLWLRLGRPPNALAGIGFIAQGFDASTYYRRTAASRDPRAAFLFEGIADELIGDFGAWGDGAAGLEIDAFDDKLGSPRHALVVATSENHSNAFLLVNEEMTSNSHGVDGTLNARVKADMVFFETLGGGAVFSTGSIAYVASLAHNGYDNNIARLTRNAVERFLDPKPFKVPPG
jgi:N,N-dimethylformamidase